jgi:hypothetical protein
LRSGYEVLSPSSLARSSCSFWGRRSAPLLGMHRDVHNVHTRHKIRNAKDFGVNVADEAKVTEGHTLL